MGRATEKWKFLRPVSAANSECTWPRLKCPSTTRNQDKQGLNCNSLDSQAGGLRHKVREMKNGRSYSIKCQNQVRICSRGAMAIGGRLSWGSLPFSGEGDFVSDLVVPFILDVAAAHAEHQHVANADPHLGHAVDKLLLRPPGTGSIGIQPAKEEKTLRVVGTTEVRDPASVVREITGLGAFHADLSRQSGAMIQFSRRHKAFDPRFDCRGARLVGSVWS